MDSLWDSYIEAKITFFYSISLPRRYSYRQLVKSASTGALSTIRFMILGTYMVL